MSHWRDRPEGGNRFWIALIRWLILHIGRPFAQAAMIPTSFYFLLRRGVERRASKRWLRTVGAPQQGNRGAWRHIYTFAMTIVDRVLLLAGRGDELDIRPEGAGALAEVLREGRGCVLLGSHLGSFEAIRVFSRRAPAECSALKVVMDRAQNSLMTRMLEEIDPAIRDTVIDARQPGPQIVLQAAAALADGAMVAMLADRVYRNEATATVEFMGSPVALPLAPLAIAATLEVPVFTVFGLYEGKRRYRLVFERLPRPATAAAGRSARRAALNQWVADYAKRLEYHARRYPYNWFNFYDYWDAARTDADCRDHGGSAGRRGS